MKVSFTIFHKWKFNMFQSNNATTVKNETLKKMFSKSRRIWQAKIDTKGPLSESRDNFEDLSGKR